MKKFIILYHAPVEALEQTQNTPPEEAAKGMEMWMKWAEQCGDQLVDLGNPLGKGQSIDVNKNSKASKKQVCGYSFLQAENMNEAKKLIVDHPHLSGWDDACTIEVHEFLPMPS